MVALAPLGGPTKPARRWRLYAAAAALCCLGLWMWGGVGPARLTTIGGGVDPSCPLSYPQLTIQDVEGGRKPYLFGGMEREGCAACQREELWSRLCRFKESHYFDAGNGRKWPTLTSCSEEVQWGQLRSWVARGYGLPLTLTPCQLWRHLEGRTLWMMGDSIMQDFFLAIRCFMFELWETLEEEPLTTDEAILKQLTFLPGWAKPRCVHLAGGNARVCFLRIDEGDKCTSGALPFLKDSGVASPNDLIIANMGLHHGQELGKLSADFAAYVAQHRAALPRVLWQQTSAQHFRTAAGEWPGGKAPYECAPLAGDAFEVQDDGELVLRPGRQDKFGLLQGGWRNRLCDPHMHAAGIPVIQSWNESVAMWAGHRDNGAGHECSHYCHPSAPQSWIVALYRTLQAPPPLPPQQEQRQEQQTSD